MTESKYITQRYVIENRENALVSIDSLGMIWTTHVRSAFAFSTQKAAEKWIARTFSVFQIKYEGIRVIDVSEQEQRPLYAMGNPPWEQIDQNEEDREVSSFDRKPSLLDRNDGSND